MHRYKRTNRKQLLIICFMVMLVLCVIALFLKNASPNQAKKTVEQFYTYEQKGEYSSSWGLLHPELQSRFPLKDYVTDRSHVFMSHFGADTFQFAIEEKEKHKKWQAAPDGQTYKDVYAFTVKQDYRGKYGHFAFVQYVYVVKDKGEWQILWDYQERK
ncbi:hypothetical protein SFC66_01380 [Terribacillus saccharophilus]|uniref:hypothetical protein n=1 Tax=Terribacillus saccharophilus TaxID=361277 RepID=UPI003981DF21